jgi:hypothetical protein
MNKTAIIFSILLIPSLCFAPVFHGPGVDAFDFIGRVLGNKKTKIGLATAKIISGWAAMSAGLYFGVGAYRDSKLPANGQIRIPLKYHMIGCGLVTFAGVASSGHGIIDLVKR